eukprot:SM000338S12942  [mRNA]  locus=s338:60271:60804:- [translate_table: standard]
MQLAWWTKMHHSESVHATRNNPTLVRLSCLVIDNNKVQLLLGTFAARRKYGRNKTASRLCSSPKVSALEEKSSPVEKRGWQSQPRKNGQCPKPQKEVPKKDYATKHETVQREIQMDA